MSIPQRRMYFYLLDKDEKLFKAVGRRAIQKIEESISITDTNLVSKSAAIEYSTNAVQEELRKAVYVAIPRFRESDLLSTYEGPSRYDLFYIIDGSHNGSTVVLTLREAAMEELNTTITGSRMSAQDSEGRDIEVSARSVIDGILENSTFEYEWRSSSTDTSIFTYDTEPISDVLADFVRVYGIEMEYVVEFDGTEVSKKILKFHDEIGNGKDRPVDRISYAHDAINIKKSEGRESIRTALIGIGSKKDITKLPHQIIADGKVVSRSRLGLSGTHMRRSDWLSYGEAGNLAEDSNALAERLDAKRVREEVVQAGMTLYESNINFKDFEFKKSEGFPVDKPLGQEYIEIPELTQVNGIKTPGGMKPKVGVSQHTDITDIKALAWKAYLEILESNREQITYTASATILNANIGDYATVVYPEVGLNDTRRVINITRNRLDDSVSGVTLGDHRARSALRRAQEVQKEEEETFVDTFLNQRPGGSNRTRSFNPLGTNFSPRDFGRFGRGNYGTIENPIGRDLFDGALFESLGLEPGQTVPEAIGGGGVGSGSSILREFEIQHSENMLNGVYPLVMEPFDTRAWSQHKFDFDQIGVSEADEEYEVPHKPLVMPKRKKVVNHTGWQTEIVEDGTEEVSMGRSKDIVNRTAYALFENNPNLIKPPTGNPNPPKPPSRYVEADNPVVKLELDNITHHTGNLYRSNPYPASLALFTRLNKSYPHGVSAPEGDRVGMAFNHVTGKVEVLQPGLAEELEIARISRTDGRYNLIDPIPDGPVALEALIDHRAISIAQFYMQSYIFPMMEAEIEDMHGRISGAVAFVREHFAIPLLRTIFDHTWALDYLENGESGAPGRMMLKPGYQSMDRWINGVRKHPHTGESIPLYASTSYPDHVPVFPWERINAIEGGIEYTRKLAAEARPYARYKSKY